MKRIRYCGWFKAVSYILFVACVATMYLSAHTLVKYDVGNIISSDKYTQSPSYKKKLEQYSQHLELHTQALSWLDQNKTLEQYALGRIQEEEGAASFEEYNAQHSESQQKSAASYQKEYQEKKQEQVTQLANNPLPQNNSNYRYVIYEKSSGKVLSTNLTDSADGPTLQKQLAALQGGELAASGEQGNYVIAGNADETFPLRDDFQQASQKFEQNYQKKGKMPAAFAGLTIGGLISLWLLWYLLSAAGLKSRKDKVHLTYFDRIYTEVFYAMVVAMGWIVYGLSYFCIETYASYEEFWRVLFITIGGALGLSVALSTFKRIRTGSLVYDSIIYRLFVLATRRWSATGRMILVTVSMAVIGMAMVAVACIHTTVAIVLALCFHGLMDIAMIAGFICWATQTDRIRHGLRHIVNGNLEHKIKTGAMVLASREIADNINRMTQSMQHAVEEQLKSERLKSELITNVSHDIKTPLTSIINYVDLLKKENIHSGHAEEYLDVLDRKSQRLKELTENLVEASKASTGNVTLVQAPVNMNEMVVQAIGEFDEKFASRGLDIISTMPEETAVIYADGRYVWRILENLFSNAFKYALERTRVYIDLGIEGETVLIEMKNISRQRLNISADELMERFVRGDASRNTEIEGSGLGLSIAQNLTQIQNGDFRLSIDGDLFKATLSFPAYRPEDAEKQPEYF